MNQKIELGNLRERLQSQRDEKANRPDPQAMKSQLKERLNAQRANTTGEGQKDGRLQTEGNLSPKMGSGYRSFAFNRAKAKVNGRTQTATLAKTKKQGEALE